MNAPDLDLLREFVKDRSQDAFTALVKRHLNLVYGAALRQTRSPQLAEEVAQSVFTDLARDAIRLRPDTILAAWLYQVTRRTALNLLRSEARRRLREQIASEIHAMNATSADWTPIESLLDEAMESLDEVDRTAVLLRYFENQSLREVGATLGASDDAAQKRVSRAVDRLRDFLVRRGVGVSSGALAAAVSTHAAPFVPTGLVERITTAVIAGLGVSVTTGGAIAKTAGVLPRLASPKLAIGGAAALLGIVILAVLNRPSAANRRDATGATDSSRAASTETTGASPAAEGLAGAVPGEPDPLALLNAVAQARRRIQSGTMELELAVDRYSRGRKESLPPRHLSVQFDGTKLRFDSVTREYAYTDSGEDESPEADARRKRADQMMDKEGAVTAGLLKGFEVHDVTLFDGTTLAGYHRFGVHGQTTIVDPAKGGDGRYFFDPRCLGLRSSLFFRGTPESCLGLLDSPKSVRVVGDESEAGSPAWHIQVQSRYDETLDFWIDKAHPSRVLKHMRGSDVVRSTFDETNPSDPIPAQLTATDSAGAMVIDKRFTRSAERNEIPFAAETFTLAGLGMPVGTAVIDERIMRRVGYWNGSGLSDGVPREGTEPKPGPDLAEMSSLLENDPASAAALDAAVWFLLNRPDSPDVEKAADVVRREHLANTNLVQLCRELGRVGHRCSTNLLEQLLEKNPSPHVRAQACLELAQLSKEAADFGRNQEFTRRATALFERLTHEFNSARPGNAWLTPQAQTALSEMRRLFVGMPAPEIAAEDLDGQPMKLSSYRGRVVVLVFWCPGCSEGASLRKTLERFSGKPLSIVGVFVDDDRTKAAADIEKYGITWPSFWDKRFGPISTEWNVHGWPNTWVLDRQGIIRHRELRGRELNDAVEALLSE